MWDLRYHSQCQYFLKDSQVTALKTLSYTNPAVFSTYFSIIASLCQLTPVTVWAYTSGRTFLLYLFLAALCNLGFSWKPHCLFYFSHCDSGEPAFQTIILCSFVVNCTSLSQSDILNSVGGFWSNAEQDINQVSVASLKNTCLVFFTKNVWFSFEQIWERSLHHDWTQAKLVLENHVGFCKSIANYKPIYLLPHRLHPHRNTAISSMGCHTGKRVLGLGFFSVLNFP